MKSKISSSKPDADLARWCAALAAEIVTDEVPPGWHTAAQLAAKLKKCDSTMGKLLLIAVRSGKCERKSFRIQVGTLARPVPHYRLA